MADDTHGTHEILKEAASKDEDQPGEVGPDKAPVEKQPTRDSEANGSDLVNSDG